MNMFYLSNELSYVYLLFRSKYVYNSKLTNLTSNSKGNQIATCSDNGKIQLWNFKVTIFTFVFI